MRAFSGGGWAVMRFLIMIFALLASFGAKADTVYVDLSQATLVGNVTGPCYCNGPLYEIDGLTPGDVINAGSVDLSPRPVSSPGGPPNQLDYVYGFLFSSFDPFASRIVITQGGACMLPCSIPDVHTVFDLNGFSVPDGASSFLIGWIGVASYTPPTITTAVPEPRTWMLLIAGFAGLAFAKVKTSAHPLGNVRNAAVLVRGVAMRFVVAIFAVLTVGSGVKAAIVDLAPATTYQVTGPWSDYADVPAVASLFASVTDLPPISSEFFYEGSKVFGSVSSGVSGALLEAAHSNIPGPACGTECFPKVFIFNEANSTISTSALTGFGWYVSSTIPYTEYPTSNVTGYFELSVPDGFQISAVPEASTWAMMLIGFAGLSYMLAGAPPINGIARPRSSTPHC